MMKLMKWLQRHGVIALTLTMLLGGHLIGQQPASSEAGEPSIQEKIEAAIAYTQKNVGQRSASPSGGQGSGQASAQPSAESIQDKIAAAAEYVVQQQARKSGKATGDAVKEDGAEGVGEAKPGENKGKGQADFDDRVPRLPRLPPAVAPRMPAVAPIVAPMINAPVAAPKAAPAPAAPIAPIVSPAVPAPAPPPPPPPPPPAR